SMGHEIGYHYEDFSLSYGNAEEAIQTFQTHLNKLKEIAEVKTICMHGSPLSKFNNHDLWKKYSYRNFGIAADVSLDFKKDEMLYLTDTGRRWDGSSYSIRDKTSPGISIHLHSTKDIIHFINTKDEPPSMMINTHPQRWNNKPLPWIRELLFQNIKNVAKKLINIFYRNNN
ncbi:MAG: hypothetical protein V1904_09870, partial [Bacteroidota bacterium]